MRSMHLSGDCGYGRVDPSTELIGILENGCGRMYREQVLEPGWIYTGIPVTKFKPNKYAVSRREILMKRDVDAEKKFEIEHEVNIDEDKKELIKVKKVSQENKKVEEM